jgi:hypothetical protein
MATCVTSSELYHGAIHLRHAEAPDGRANQSALPHHRTTPDACHHLLALVAFPAANR